MASSSVPLFSIPPPTAVNDTHKVYSVAIGIILIGIFTTITVALRLLYRFYKKKNGLDDYAIIVSLVFFIGWTILGAIANLSAGIGKPLNEITLPEYTIWFQSLVAITFLYPWTSASIRVSIVLFYRQIFSKGSGPILRWSLWALLALQAIYALVFTFVPLPMCTPFYYAWVPLERSTHCSLVYWYYVQEAQYGASLALDGMLLFFPIAPVLNLQMPLKRRLAVIGIFVLGAAASIATAIKLAFWVEEWTQTLPVGIPNWYEYSVALFVPPQFDREGVTVFIPSQMEPALGLIGASLPALWPLAKSATQRVYGSMTDSSKSTDKPLKGSGVHVSYNLARHVRVGSGKSEERKFYPLSDPCVDNTEIELQTHVSGGRPHRAL